MELRACFRGNGGACAGGRWGLGARIFGKIFFGARRRVGRNWVIRPVPVCRVCGTRQKFRRSGNSCRPEVRACAGGSTGAPRSTFHRAHFLIPLVRTLLLLLIVSLALLSSLQAGDAHHALYAVTPQSTQADGIIFHITSESLAGGLVRFRAAMSEGQAKFSLHPITEIGYVKDPRDARSIHSAEKAPSTRVGSTLVCVFTVKEDELRDPNFCFLFNGVDRSARDTIGYALSPEYVFARLKDFAPRHRAK